MTSFKVFVAEFIGTFALVFIGAGATVVGIGGLVGAALAYGLVIATFYYIYGHISGAHFNPAVTFGLALNGTIRWKDTVVYWLAQFAGAALGALALNFVVSSVSGLNGGATVGTLTDPQPMTAMLVEVILTFFLVNTVLHAAVAGKAGQFAGLVIGFTLVFAVLAGGPMTGASMNPARTFGPAIFTTAIDQETRDITSPILYLIYFAGPLLGSALAVGVFKLLNSGDVVVEESAKRQPKKK
jgi:MIP family channel proteins